MIFLISLALTGLFVHFCAKSLKEKPVPYYIAGTGMAAAVVVCTFSGVDFPGWFNSWVWPIFSRSALATALFAVVMWTGALPNGSSAIKKLMPIRGELSILACILTLGHNIAYGKTYFRLLLTRPERLPANQLAAAICSLVMIIIMVPLFVTSFKSVRRKMDGRSWKRLQRFAYGFYALLYIHVMLLTVPYALEGRASYVLNLLVYSAVFLGYAFCRVLKYQATQKKEFSRLAVRQRLGAVAALALSLCLTVGAYAYGGSEGGNEPQNLPVQSSQENQSAVPGGDNSEMEEVPADLEQSAAPDTSEVLDVPQDDTQEEPAQTGGEEPVQNEQQTGDAAGNQAETQTSPPAIQPEPEPEPAPEPAPEPEPEPVRVYKDGTFTGTGEGYMDYITVSVTIQNDVITGISIVSASDDDPYFSDAKGVIGKILAAQSANVDAVSGATFSSKGIIDGVKAALSSAKN